MDFIELQKRGPLREWQFRNVQGAMLISRSEGALGLKSLTLAFHRARGGTRIGKWNSQDALRYYWGEIGRCQGEGLLLVHGTWYDVAATRLDRETYGPWRRTWFLEPHGGYANGSLDWWLK